MLKTFFGCCPLRHGVSAIAIFNTICNLFEIMEHVVRRYDKYGLTAIKRVEHHDSAEVPTETPYAEVMNSTSTTDSYDDIDTYYSNWTEFEKVDILSGIFMNYLFMVTISWIVLGLVSNICLKQSTFKRAPHKVYVWLVSAYANLSFLGIILLHNVIRILIIPEFDSSIVSIVHPRETFEHLMTKLLFAVVICFEIVVVHSFYIAEKKAMLHDFVQLRWKYVSKGKVVSKGVDYTSASVFEAETSRHTQDVRQSYMANIIQD